MKRLVAIGLSILMLVGFSDNSNARDHEQPKLKEWHKTSFGDSSTWPSGQVF
jgi:hypothetical protein